MIIDPRVTVEPCPNEFCVDGEHAERLCSHSGRCPCDPLTKVCTLCKGRGFIERDPSEGGAATEPFSLTRSPLVRRETAETIGRAW